MSTKKMSFVDAVKMFLKGGDDRKLVRFHQRITKEVDDQIDLRDREIDDLKEKIEDSHIAEKDAILAIELKELTDTDSIKKYSTKYIDGLLKFQRDRKKLNDEIAEKKVENDYLKSLKIRLQEIEVNIEE